MIKSSKFFLLYVVLILIVLTVAGCNTTDKPNVTDAPNATGTAQPTDFIEPTETTPKPTQTPTPKPPAASVTFSKEGGFYNTNFSVSLTGPTGYKVYYTTDGTDPRTNGIEYTGPITVANSETASIGPITANIGSYGSSRKMRGTVIRACAKKGTLTTTVVTNTYFVSNNLAEKYELPYISISLKPSEFQNPDGIYVKPSISNNMFDTKRRIIVFAEFFDETGKKRDNLYAEMSLQGNGSMGATMKSLRLYFKKDLDTDSAAYPSKLKYDIFGGRVKDKDGNTIDSFKRLVLRNSGNDYNRSMLRDRLFQKLSEPLTCDTQASQPVMVFINGEFWGMYNARERYDAKYFEAHYGILEENFVMLEAPTPLKFPDRSYTNPYEICDGVEGDQKPWEDLIKYIDSHNLSNEAYYKVVTDQVDIYSIMDVYIANCYFGNADWPGNNVKVWRNKNPKDPSGMDTKWRFVLMDTDMGAGFNNGPENNFMGHAFNRGTGWILTKLMTSLLQNEGFKQEFVTRFFYAIDNYYAPEKSIPVLEAMAKEIEKAMELNVARWPQNSMSQWRNDINVIRDFLQRRPQYIKEHLRSYFGVYTKEVTYVYDSTKATLKVNNAVVAEGFTRDISNNEQLALSVTPKAGYTFVSIVVTDNNGAQTTYTNPNVTITLKDKSTISVLMKKNSISIEPQIIAGSRSVMVITKNGDLYAWGSNEYGQNGVHTTKNVTRPILITTGVVKVSTSLGGNVGDAPHTLILTEDNVLYSIGNNNFGQLGRTGNAFALMMVNIQGTIKDISAGFDHSVVLMENGDLYGVGNNAYGQLGTTNHGGQVNTFIKIASNVKAAAAGRRHTIWVDNSGKAFALGDNRWNKLTTSSQEQYTSPVQLMTNIKNVFAGEHSSFLIDNNNDLYYLGWRNHVHLGSGGSDGQPHRIMSNVKSVSMMDEHALILTLDNKAYGWGLNSYSQVTSGNATQSTPVHIADNVRGVAAGSWFSAILYQDGRVVVWGKNTSGVAGNGTESDRVGMTTAMTGVTK